MQMSIEDTNMLSKVEQPMHLIEIGIKNNGNNIRPKSYVVYNKTHVPNKVPCILVLEDCHTKLCLIFL
jgi:hypothetical protein